MGIVVKSHSKPVVKMISQKKLIAKTINASLLSCAPVTITDENATVLEVVPAGGGYVVQNVDIIDQDLNVIEEVPAGGTYNVLVFDGIDGGAPGTVYTNSIVGGTP